jgi:hypothetical protein
MSESAHDSDKKAPLGSSSARRRGPAARSPSEHRQFLQADEAAREKEAYDAVLSETPAGGQAASEETETEGAAPAVPTKASEILRLVREMLAEWFARGHLLLRAWRQHDPTGANSLRPAHSRPAFFLDRLLRRLNEYRRAAWIDFVLNYQGSWFAVKAIKDTQVFVLADLKPPLTDSLWRQAEPLDKPQALRLLATYAAGRGDPAALHVPLVNALCYAIAGTLVPVPSETGPTTGWEAGRFAPESFLSPRLSGLHLPAPHSLWSCLHEFLEVDDNTWGRFSIGSRSLLHTADRRFSEVYQASLKTVLPELHRYLSQELPSRPDLLILCAKLKVLGDLAAQLGEIFPPETIKEKQLPWIPALIQNLTRLGRLVGIVLGDQTPPLHCTQEDIPVGGDAERAGRGHPGHISEDQLRRWTNSPPNSEAEIVQFARAVLERWFARGDELLSAWQHWDPEARKVLLGKKPPFLTWLLRRCNEVRQVAWIEQVLSYDDHYYNPPGTSRGGRNYVVPDPAVPADRLWRRAAPLGPPEALSLLRTYAAGGEETPALHIPVVNALCHAVAGAVVAGPAEAEGPFAPEHFLSPDPERIGEPLPDSLRNSLIELLVVKEEGGGRFNPILRASLREAQPQRFGALYTADVQRNLEALTNQLTSLDRQDSLQECCVKLEKLGKFAERLQLIFTEKTLKQALPAGALLAMQNVIRLGELAANVLGDRSPLPARPDLQDAPRLGSSGPSQRPSPPAAGKGSGILPEAQDSEEEKDDLDPAAQGTAASVLPPSTPVKRRAGTSAPEEEGGRPTESTSLDLALEAGTAVPGHRVRIPTERPSVLSEAEDTGPTTEDLQTPAVSRGTGEKLVVAPPRPRAPAPRQTAAETPPAGESAPTAPEAKDDNRPLTPGERIERLVEQFDMVKRFQLIARWGNALRERCREDWPEAVEGLGVLLATYRQFQDGLLCIEPKGPEELARWIEEEQGVLADSLVNNIELLDALLPPEGRDGPEPPPSHVPIQLVGGLRQVQRRVFEFMREYGQYDYYPLRYGDEARDHPALEILGSVPMPGMRSFCVVQIVQPGYIKPPGGRERPVRPPKVLVAR